MAEKSKRARDGRCNVVLLAALVSIAASVTYAADWPQFRGPNRDGKSRDKGLLNEWPEGGPKRLWVAEGLGQGYASVAVAKGMIYTTGLHGSTGYRYAFNLDGELKWKMPYGPEWTGDYPGTRTTPTVIDGLVYVMSAHGRVVCFDAVTGEQEWHVDTRQEFGAQSVSWGIVESLLIDGDNLICTPGGSAASVVALNRKTGKTVWACQELREPSGFCSPTLVKRGELRIIVTLTRDSLVGIDAKSGTLLWAHRRNAHDGIQPVSLVYEEGRIYITSGYGGERGEMFELSEDGRSITRKWGESKLDCHHGGVIVHKGHVYGASDKNRPGKWICLHLKTGEVAAEIPAVGKGSIAFADGMVYGYGENGTVGLINPSPTDFRLVSSFKVSEGDRQHWAHPAIANGRLYIRHGDALMAYDIKAE